MHPLHERHYVRMSIREFRPAALIPAGPSEHIFRERIPFHRRDVTCQITAREYIVGVPPLQFLGGTARKTRKVRSRMESK